MGIKRIQALFHPERYHGWGYTRRYFEGWYYKLINAAEDQLFAFIPGIAMDHKGSRHAFIQVLDGKKQSAEYISFPYDLFRADSGVFNVKVGESTFSQEKLKLRLKNIAGEVFFKNTTPWPSRWYSPGIMGPFAFVPFMECYHGVVSMDHRLEGELVINTQTIDFTGGRGYIEKDWGRSFPEAYTWMQSNHFSQPGISFKASVAKIPWLGSSFTGFIAGLYFDGHLFAFTTYNSTKLVRSLIDLEKAEFVMENRNYRLEFLAHRDHPTELASPIQGLMDGRIGESMTSTVEVRLTGKKTGELLFVDTGRNTALEIAGKIEEITLK